MPPKKGSADSVIRNQASEIQKVEVRLYCAEHCRICEEAKSIVLKAGIVAHNIDILENDNLFTKYRSRIPVLQRVDNNAELDGPFDTPSIFKFLMSPLYA